MGAVVPWLEDLVCVCAGVRLHARKALLIAARRANHFQHIEAHSLAERPALASEDLVASLDTEGRGAVHRGVLVALLETVVLGDVVEVILADDDGVLHLGGLDHARDHLAADVDTACMHGMREGRGSADAASNGVRADQTASRP